MNIRDIVEHKDKKSTGKYSHDGMYEIVDFCRMKDPTTHEWINGIIYRNIKTYEIFVREKNDFEDKFKINKEWK